MDNDHEEDTWETFTGSPNTGAEDTGHPLLDPGSPSGAFSPSSSTPKPREPDEETTLLTVDGEPRPEYPDETQPTQSEAADARDNEDDSTLPVSVPPVEESASMPEDQTATEPGSAVNHHDDQNRGDSEVISNISGGSGRDHDDEDTEVNEDGEREEGEALEGEGEQPDPWSLAPDFTGDDKPKWSELSTRGKVRRVCIEWIGKALGICACIYFFIVALSLMGDAFTLIGGSAAGAALSDSSLLKIPIAGLMIGMLVTVLLQSSSATTSIIVSMVASDIINVPEAIPMVMGANLGTSVTNTIVAGGQAGDRETFRRSFAGATVHDCFNWLAVLVLLPIESISGYLYHLTTAIVKGSNLQQIGGADRVKISDPITKLIIQLDLQALEKIALGEELTGDESFVKRWCVTEEYYYNETVYDANGTLYNYTTVHSYTKYIERCK
ncbi:sodium-dependent phosphate transport protein 2B-like [Ptychodera flava]|uniref:sodium-dependent phosphate transport protein 2B-like n=1 Tax=Ptychodera flava TaxID=63121 RepID=UPI00396A93BF